MGEEEKWSNMQGSSNSKTKIMSKTRGCVGKTEQLANPPIDRLANSTARHHRCQEAVSQGYTPSGHGCQTDRSTHNPSSVASVKAKY